MSSGVFQSSAQKIVSRRACSNTLKVFAVCAVLSVLLEFGTLAGAPLLTPLNLDHWRLKRMAFFFVLCLLAYLYWRITRDDCVKGPVALIQAWWQRSDVARRAVGIVAAVAAIPGALVVLSFVATHLVGEGYDIRLPFVVVMAALSLGALLLLRDKIASHLEYGFLVLSLSFGTIMCACMPVIAEVSWDGQIHFNNTQAMSYVLDAEYTEADLMMTRPDAVTALDLLGEGDLSTVWQVAQDAPSVSSAQDQLIALDGSVAETSLGATRSGGASWISAASIGYVPAATGLWVARLLGLSCLGRYFLARFASVVAYSLIFFLAVRRLKSGKTIVAALGLLPTPLLMASNFSYDPWCFTCVTYAFARYVGCIQGDGKIRRCDATAIFGSFFFGALVKAVIFPLLFVFFLAPRRCFCSRRSEQAFRFGAVLTVALLLGSFAIPFIASGASGGDSRGGSEVSSAGQVAFILSDPLGYLSIFLRFTFGYFNPLDLSVPSDMLANMLVVFPYLGDLWTTPTIIASLLEWTILIVCSLLDRNELDASYRGVVPKVATAVGFAGAFFLVATALYVSFTPVGMDDILGVQHRYLLSFLPCVLLVLLNFCNARSVRLRGALSYGFLGVEWATLLFVIATMFVASF